MLAPPLPPSTAPTHRAIPLLQVSPPPCFLSAFFQKHRQGNRASRSTVPSDACPLTASTSHPIPAQPWQHCSSKLRAGADTPPGHAVLLGPCTGCWRDNAPSQQPPFVLRSNALLTAFPENTQQKMRQAGRKKKRNIYIYIYIPLSTRGLAPTWG